MVKKIKKILATLTSLIVFLSMFSVLASNAEAGIWTAMGTNEEHDPTAGTWTTKSPLPHARLAHCVGVVNSKMYIIDHLINILQFNIPIIGIFSKLHVEGSKIKDEFGRTVYLRGVNKASLEWRMDGAHWVEDDVATSKSWGCNVQRITFNRGWWVENPLGNDGITYREHINQAITWGEKHGLYTILAMIWWTRTEQLLPMPLDVPAWIDTWKEIAQTYKDRPVLFDIWGEPYSVADADWWNAAQQCVNAIRTVTNNIILVAVNHWSHHANLVQNLGHITGGNIVYPLHLYPHELGSFPSNVQGIKDYLTTYGWRYILDNNIAPVIVGEFGAYPEEPEEVEWMRTFVRIMNGFENDATDWRMSYIAWCFNSGMKHKLIESDWVTPTASGKVLIEAI